MLTRDLRDRETLRAKGGKGRIVCPLSHLVIRISFLSRECCFDWCLGKLFEVELKRGKCPLFLFSAKLPKKKLEKVG